MLGHRSTPITQHQVNVSCLQCYQVVLLGAVTSLKLSHSSTAGQTSSHTTSSHHVTARDQQTPHDGAAYGTWYLYQVKNTDSADIDVICHG